MNSYRLVCPCCEANLEVPGNLRARRVQCPACQNRFIVRQEDNRLRLDGAPTDAAVKFSRKKNTAEFLGLSGIHRPSSSTAMTPDALIPRATIPPTPLGAPQPARPGRLATRNQARLRRAEAVEVRPTWEAAESPAELVLEEQATVATRSEEKWATRPVWLGLGLAASFVTTLLLLVLEPGGSAGGARRQAELRRAIELYYFQGPPRPYQVLLRQAQQAAHLGHSQAERALYRRVLDLLHSEGLDPVRGMTGRADGSEPPNDKHLAECLSELLAS